MGIKVKNVTRIKCKKLATSMSIVSCFLSTDIYSQDHNLVLGLGTAGLFDEHQLVSAKASYEFSPLENYWQLRPLVQILATDTGAYHLSLGAIKEFPINNNWHWGISFSAGAFHQDTNDDGNDLDYDVEFYSTLSLSYKLSKQNNIRLELGHISNAGFGDTNPGSETLFISYISRF